MMGGSKEKRMGSDGHKRNKNGYEKHDEDNLLVDKMDDLSQEDFDSQMLSMI